MQDLITFLHADGLITRNESIAIKRAANDLHENPVRIIRSLNIASPKDIQKCFKIYFNYSLVTDALVDNLTGEYASLVPIDLAIHFSVFGFGDEEGKLYVGMEDPSDKRTLEALKFFLGKEIIASAANIYQLSKAMEKLYGLTEEISGLETILDKARGAGAWSQKERMLFEKIIEERNMREQEEASAVTYVSSKPAARLSGLRKERQASQKLHRISEEKTSAVNEIVPDAVAQTVPQNHQTFLEDEGPPEVAATAAAAQGDVMQVIESIDSSELPDIDSFGFDLDNPADEFALNQAESGSSESALAAQDEHENAAEMPAFEPDIESVELEAADFDDLALQELPVAEDPVAQDFGLEEEGTDFTETENDQESTRNFEILPDRAELARLVQKCTLKVALARDLQQALQASNAIFAAATDESGNETGNSKKSTLSSVVFFQDEDIGVGVSYDHLTLSSGLLDEEPWSALGPLIKALRKKITS